MELSNEQVGFLKELVSLPTPTGSEHAGMMLLGRRLKAATGLEPSIDIHGNLHCVLDRGAKRTVMMEGHCDEIGFMVVHVDDDEGTARNGQFRVRIVPDIDFPDFVPVEGNGGV